MKLLKQIEKRLAEIDELTRPTLEAEIWTPIPDSSQESAFFCDVMREHKRSLILCKHFADPVRGGQDRIAFLCITSVFSLNND